MIDLRSDTVTRPTPAMRQAMASAEVGDDVFGDDPTVNRLQERVAEMLGKEAAVYVPSGTMSNQIGVRVHCQPGDEFICEAGCHIYNYEQAGYAQLSGLAARTVEGDFGVLRLEQLTGLVRRRERSSGPHPAGVSGKHPQPRQRAHSAVRRSSATFAAGLMSSGWPRIWMAPGCLMPWLPPAYRLVTGHNISTRSAFASAKAWERRLVPLWLVQKI